MRVGLPSVELPLLYSSAGQAVLRGRNLFLYNADMSHTTHRLLWETIAPGQAFHAALVTPRAASTRLHAHDFYEVFFVEEGTGTHHVHGQAQTLAAGDLVFIRPDDAHAFGVRPGRNLHFINIAFRRDLWQAFALLADTPDWNTPVLPPRTRLSPARRGEASAAFGRALRAFHAGGKQWELCRFWGEAAGLMLAAAEDAPTPFSGEAPPWLARACQLMAREEHLRAGLPALLDLCGVSEAHLARSLKAACGLTPTAWINRQRLARAAALLATTPVPILDIALDCGFENLSYFYRRFGQQYGQSPRAYRLAARRRVMPDAAQSSAPEENIIP